MPRYLFALALAFSAVLTPLAAQVYTIQPRPVQVDNKPRGGFSLSFRKAGATSVRFEDVGSIASLKDIGDTISNIPRSYDDGFILQDARGVGGVLDDGRSNRWLYQFPTQYSAATDDIAFHRYSTATDGSDVTIDSGSLAGVDMEYDAVFGVFGPKVTDKAWTFTWGGMVSGVFSAVNAKTRQDVSVNLLTTTDYYALEGVIPPTAPYSAPSTKTITGVDANGAPVTLTVDNTLLLNNRPYRRTLDVMTPDATVRGYWQVKGGYYTVRVGPWMRWQLGRRVSFRASAGGTFTFLGVTMEYDEYFVPGTGIDMLGIVRGGAITRPDKSERFGYFGALDAEFWLTERTGFFAGVTVEDNGKDVELTSGGRRAVVELPNGTGIRVGMSVLF